MPDRNYQVWVYKSTSTGVSSGNVDFTFQTELAAPPTITDSVMRPLEGRSESMSWSVPIVDVNSTVMARIADSSGRMNILNRMVAIRGSLATSSGSTFMGVGRVTDVVEQPDRTFQLVAGDELTLARQTEIFSTNTTRLFPMGVHKPYGPFSPGHPAKATVYVDEVINGVRRVFLRLDETAIRNAAGVGMLQGAVSQITGDQVSSGDLADWSTVTGNFKNVRVRLFTDPSSSGKDFGIVGFGTPTDLDIDANRFDVLAWTITQIGGLGSIKDWALSNGVSVWVATKAAAGAWTHGFIHMFGHDPTPITPLHIGGRGGKHPADHAKDALTGLYSTASSVLPRLSTASIDTMRANPMVAQRFRITGPSNMLDWVSESVLAPNLLAPVPARDGSIHIKSLERPNSTGDIKFTFTESNLASHPTWRHARSEQITQIKYNYTHETSHYILHPVTVNQTLGVRFNVGDVQARGTLRPQASDLIDVTDRQDIVLHDRVTKIGKIAYTIDAEGYHTSDNAGFGVTVGVQPVTFGSHQSIIPHIKRHAPQVLYRFGDGPIRGKFTSLSTAENLDVGDWVKITLNTYPDPTNLGRGGNRIVQLVGRQQGPQGPTWDYIDGGPSLSPPSAPTLTLATSPIHPRHRLVVTVGNVPGAGGVELRLAESSTQPSSGSTKWNPSGLNITATGQFNIDWLPNNSTWFVGGVAFQNDNAFKSTLAISTKQNTAALTAPTINSFDSVRGGGTIICRYTPGHENYPTGVYLDTSTSATLTTSNLVGLTRPGARFHLIAGLDVATTYFIGLRHHDAFGGFSAFDTTKFATTGTKDTLPPLAGFVRILGDT